jgi:hypothetical protein
MARTKALREKVLNKAGYESVPTGSGVPGSAIIRPIARTTMPLATTTNTVNAGATFGQINYNPVSGSVGILGLGGGGAGTGGLTVNQQSTPTTNISTQQSTTTTTTSTYAPVTTSQVYEYITNMLNSPYATSGAGGQSSSPEIIVVPSVSTPQTSTQSAIPTLTTEQTAAGGTQMGLVEILIIGGVAITGIWLISRALKPKKGRGK